ncbi:hypothetical protein BS78_01G353500 [Paspalum vaginatum]|nr:hypothetical protein BS78_01G353500 [Paspalum vaginatum]
MAVYYPTSMQEDDVHRLLPREILKDLGIMDPGEQQLVDAIEDLAAHLASVLGGTPKKTSRHHPQVNVGRGLGGVDVLAGGGNVRRVAVPPPFLPAAPAAPWQVMESLRRNNMVLHPIATMPGLAAASRPLTGGAQPPTTVRLGAGTGVFLPRTAAVPCTAARPPSNGKHGRFAHRRGRGLAAAAASVKTQQEMHAMAAAQMDQRYLGAHARRRELALPQEWTY